jgi:NADH:ubiquinone oxidoreductase subunit 6 (subunit J)
MHDQETPRPPATTLALYVLAVFTVVMGIVAGYKIYQAYQAEASSRGQYYPLLFWASFNTVAGIAAALWVWSWKPAEGGRGQATDPTKLIILGVGGVLGFTTVIFLGLGYVYLWWDDLVKARTAWKEFKTWIPALLILGGLAVMLLSVLAVRSEERHNVVLRRLIYGYNAVLVGLLVFAILGVGNVMASIYAFRPLDWTETNIYSISEPSKLILEKIDVPVKVHVLVSPRDPLHEDMRTLLDGARSYNRLLEVEFLNDPRALEKLYAQYELLDGTAAVVVLDPDETKGKRKHEAIKIEELEDPGSRFGSQGRQRDFKGDQAVMSAIRNLVEGKITETIYFTQDSGEMKLSEIGSRRDRPGGSDRGLGQLKLRLEKAGYTVKELNLGEIDAATKEPAKVPADAFAVILAGPTDLGASNLAAGKIKVLQEYMNRKEGKLIVLVEAHRNRDGVVQPTGLEGFLAGYGVDVKNDIILHLRVNVVPDPTMAILGLAPDSDRAFRTSFRTSGPIYLTDVRTVQPLAGSTTFTAQRLLVTLRFMQGMPGQWAETELRGDPEEFIKNLEEKQPEEYNRKLQSTPITVAVTVREKSADAAMPDDQFHSQARQTEGRPRLVVFGSADLISNNNIERGRETYYSLFAGSLAWLRGGKTEVLAEIAPRTRQSYRMNVQPDDLGRIIWMPVLVLLIGVVGAGIAVLGFIRRR